MSPLTAQPPAKDALPAQVEEAKDTQRQHRSAIKAAFIGTFIEWFDYAAYIYMSAIISRVFFPEMERPPRADYDVCALRAVVPGTAVGRHCVGSLW